MSYKSLENARYVADLMRRATETLMLPRFGNLSADHIHTKLDKSIVTQVDLDVEAFLIRELQAAFPESVAFGEESFAADPEKLKLFQDKKPLWVIDPLDGTSAFAERKPNWGTLLSYVENGRTEMACIMDAISGRVITIVQGEGTFLDGIAMQNFPASKPIQEQSGMVWFSYFRDDIRPILKENTKYFQKTSGGASGVEFAFRLLEGKVDFMPGTMSYPWDMLPLALLCEEMGGRAAKLVDGHPFSGERLINIHEPSLMVRHAAQWGEIRDIFFRNISQEDLAICGRPAC